MFFSTMASDVDGGDRTGWLYGRVTRGAVPSWRLSYSSPQGKGWLHNSPQDAVTYQLREKNK